MIAAPIEEGSVLGKITYTIDGTEYSSDLIANQSVEEFKPLTLLARIALVLFVLFIIGKLLLPKKKKKSKKSNYKKKNSGTKKRNSIYKF